MYKIIIDSCGELTQEMKESGVFKNVPLTLQIDDINIVDDETFDQADFIKRVAESPNCPKSACPSPDTYMSEFAGYEELYVVTLSGRLSGSYNSACLAKDMYLEDNENVKIHVFDSCSASIGETLIGLKVKELKDAGKSFEEVVEITEEYIKGQHTFFVLESIEALRKNGRLSNLKAFIANTLNIKPILGSTDDGSICQLGQARGVNKAIEKMCEILKNNSENTEDKILAISHCNCEERAIQLKGIVSENCNFKDIIIVNMAGVSTLYASDGGVIMVV